jgi:hypothetical protein
MSKIKRYMKNIKKQYGKNIKAFENRELEPSKEVQELWERIHNETKGSLDMNQHKPMMSIIQTRWGLSSRGSDNLINSYDDIEKVANEN